MTFISTEEIIHFLFICKLKSLNIAASCNEFTFECLSEIHKNGKFVFPIVYF